VAEIGRAATAAAEAPAPGGDTVFVKARVSTAARWAARRPVAAAAERAKSSRPCRRGRAGRWRV